MKQNSQFGRTLTRVSTRSWWAGIWSHAFKIVSSNNNLCSLFDRWSLDLISRIRSRTKTFSYGISKGKESPFTMSIVMQRRAMTCFDGKTNDATTISSRRHRTNILNYVLQTIQLWTSEVQGSLSKLFVIQGLTFVVGTDPRAENNCSVVYVRWNTILLWNAITE